MAKPSKNSRRKRGKRGGYLNSINSMTRMASSGIGMLSSSLPTFSQGTPKVEESQTVEEFIKQHNIPEWIVVDNRLNIYTPEYLKAEGVSGGEQDHRKNKLKEAKTEAILTTKTVGETLKKYEEVIKTDENVDRIVRHLYDGPFTEATGKELSEIDTKSQIKTEAKQYPAEYKNAAGIVEKYKGQPGIKEVKEAVSKARYTSGIMKSVLENEFKINITVGGSMRKKYGKGKSKKRGGKLSYSLLGGRRRKSGRKSGKKH